MSGQAEGRPPLGPHRPPGFLEDRLSGPVANPGLPLEGEAVRWAVP